MDETYDFGNKKEIFIQTQVGNGFPKQAELEAAEERIAELEEQMKVELAAIEAQEETDKSGTATIDIDPDELIDDNAGNGLRFRDGGNPFGSDAPGKRCGVGSPRSPDRPHA